MKQHIITYGSGRLEINGVSVGLPPSVFMESLIEQGFSVSNADENPALCFGNVVGLGPCIVKVFRMGNTIGLVIITTERKYNEEEMTLVFNQMKEDLPGEPLFYDGGCFLPTHHQMNHCWDLEQGHITFEWDGYADVRGEALDNIALWLRKPLVKDEEYWRSEVD